MFEWINRSINDPNYDVENDIEAMTEKYVCQECGCTFTLDEASSDFMDHIDGISYLSTDYRGDLCGICAAEKMENI